ncbi:hypothetical protein [Paractinoplanes ferrugineus]|uniref:hypothetical protein n=1 Tax=Paractinoplanes ferrugineus TaxID=113564 RepID=UPI0019414100|nr:hypothetical protein [Actinoplanes ferrugineus]
MAVWSRNIAEPAAARPWRPERLPPPGEASASVEGVLAAQLEAGDITHEQYVLAMERLAARDEFRHPLEVPPDR